MFCVGLGVCLWLTVCCKVSADTDVRIKTMKVALMAPFLSASPCPDVPSHSVPTASLSELEAPLRLPDCRRVTSGQRRPVAPRCGRDWAGLNQRPRPDRHAPGGHVSRARRPNPVRGGGQRESAAPPTPDSISRDGSGGGGGGGAGRVPLWMRWSLVAP